MTGPILMQRSISKSEVMY